MAFPQAHGAHSAHSATSRRERSTDAPLSLDVSRSAATGPSQVRRFGIAAASTVTDNIVHLHARDIGSTCWQGYDRTSPARLTVALEVGIDGKIRYAAASGETNTLRGCVEAHVKGWEFLPQSQAQTMVLPFEVDRR
jgi:hypothetical protein